MWIFLCPDSIEGIFTGVYDAWDSRAGHGNVRLALAGYHDMELFVKYVQVEEDREKAEKVLRTLRRRLHIEDFHAIYHAALSADEEKADSIYRVIVLAFHTDRRVTDNLENASVSRVFEMARRTANEARRYLEFLRFRELRGGALFAEIEPEAQVLPLIGDHFADRFPLENFLIYDRRRGTLLFHPAEKPWILMEGAGSLLRDAIVYSDGEEEISKGWQDFFDKISITERENRNLQRQFLPLKYRGLMTEKIGNKR